MTKGKCRFCDDDAEKRINDDGECADHAGESKPFDQEEAEDWDSYLEYINK